MPPTTCTPTAASASPPTRTSSAPWSGRSNASGSPSSSGPAAPEPTVAGHTPQREDHSMSPLFNGGKPIEILLVEDNADDAQMTLDALRTGRVRNRVHWVEDGED